LGFVLLAAKDLLRLVAGAIRHTIVLLRRLAAADSTTVPARPVPADPQRRFFLKAAGTTTIGLVAATPVAASLATARDYQVRRIPLTFPHLPAELEGFTLAQVSDLHSGIYMSRSDMEHIFDIVNGLHAQLTVITGDLVDTNDTEIPPLRNALKTLRADRGVYAVLGNHDHFATGDLVAAGARDAGVRVLRNTHETLTVDGAKLSLIGIDDPSPRRNFADLAAAVEGLDPESFKVMLVHQPRFWPDAKRTGMDLTLVGHTHGGQIGMELMGMKLYPVRWAYDYPMGHYIEEGRQLYVNVGVGMVGAPIRLVRPEIAIFELRRGEPVLYSPPKI
jgi:predicted MPP superfamily phosphohydrolase